MEAFDRINLTLWGLLALGAAGIVYLAVQLILSLRKLESKDRRGLFPVGIALAVLALLLFGGNVALEVLGFTWRSVPRWVLSIALWFTGWAAGILTAVATGRRMRSAGRKDSGLWSGLCWVSLCCSMFIGTLAGVLWLASFPGEKTDTLEGTRWVETQYYDEYALYPYMGPLIRSTDAVQTSEHPILRELFGADKDLDLDLSAGAVLLASDNHGGFQGDGDTWLVLTFPDNSLEDQLQGWDPLPLTGAALNAVERNGENGWEIPKEGNGYWHYESRGPYNFTLAVWNRDAHQLIYWVSDM